MKRATLHMLLDNFIFEDHRALFNKNLIVEFTRLMDMASPLSYITVKFSLDGPQPVQVVQKVENPFIMEHYLLP